MSPALVPLVAPAAAQPQDFDPTRVRQDFPALHQEIHGRPLVYLDSAASAHKPQAVIDAMARAYSGDYANVHRGVHTLSQRATTAFENAREKVSRFLGAAAAAEIVFVRGTTEAINLVAHSFVRPRLQVDDLVLISALEHHSNIVPWQLICAETGAHLRVIPLDEHGDLDLEAALRWLNLGPKFLTLTHVSNALGTVNPVAQLVAQARERGIPTLLDGAQAVPHMPVDVQALGCDFYAFSGHKLFGPTGIGVLYGRGELLASMPPYQGGGEMIRSVTFAKSEFAPPPHRFEAGTPHIVGAIGLAAAIDYLEQLGREAVYTYEQELVMGAVERLREMPGVELIGHPKHRAAVISFVVQGVHAHDVGTILDHEGIALRVGHHCAQPLMDHFGIPATVRAAFACYNTRADVDRLILGLRRVVEIFG